MYSIQILRQNTYTHFEDFVNNNACWFLICSHTHQEVLNYYVKANLLAESIYQLLTYYYYRDTWRCLKRCTKTNNSRCTSSADASVHVVCLLLLALHKLQSRSHSISSRIPLLTLSNTLLANFTMAHKTTFLTHRPWQTLVKAIFMI